MSLPNTIQTFLPERQSARDRAHELVKEITRRHGFLDEDVYTKMEPDVDVRWKKRC